MSVDILSLDDVKRRVAEIAREVAEDDNVSAHIHEDALYHDVLEAIAWRQCADSPAEMAAEAITVRAMDFRRWHE